MKVTTKLTNFGIKLLLHKNEIPGNLKPATDADQVNPRQYYVYAHLDSSGKVFYVGKGTGSRAWSTDRHPLWFRYVEKHLNGEYQVIILHDNLSAEDVEEVEAEWIAQCSETVVNWVNMGRKTDFEALDRRNSLRDVNLSLIQQAIAIEEYDLEKATSMYIQVIEAIQAYVSITYEKGLVGQLLEEEAAELGLCGEIKALDRLTICLIKLGRPMEAVQHTDNYFNLYRRDLKFSAAERIMKRVNKASAHMQTGVAAPLMTVVRK